MLDTAQTYDVTLLGYYTKDTIISAAGARLVDGGACNYGANVAARMGLNTAVVTRLVQEDFHVADALRELDIDGEGQ